MFQAITETLVLVLGSWGRFLKRHSLLGFLVSGVVVYARHKFFRAFCSLRRRRFSRLRLRQVRVSRRRRGGIRKSTAPRMGARRDAGITLFRSLTTEVISTSLAI